MLALLWCLNIASSSKWGIKSALKVECVDCGNSVESEEDTEGRVEIDDVVGEDEHETICCNWQKATLRSICRV